MLRRPPACASSLLIATLASYALAPVAAAQEPVDLAMTARIRDEGLNRSQALPLYYALTDGIGARLPGSPAFDESAVWARDRFADWGLDSPRLEPFEFGRGWSLEKISVEMTAPRYMPLIGYAEAWTPSITGTGVVEGRVIYIGESTREEIEAMAPSLRGAIVLTRQPQIELFDVDRPQPGLTDEPVRTGNPPGMPSRSTTPNGEIQAALGAAGAAVTLRPSGYRDGTVGVTGSRTTANDAVPSIMVAAEQYNVLARLAASGAPPTVRVELRTRYHEESTTTHNVIAEIRGTDPVLANELVIIGGHIDSWHTATGGTDNGDGVIAAMEAMRILAAVGARPRRTIQVVLWSGEEQGLLGARAYVEAHLADAAARDRISVLLNDDPGSGASLGIYMQENAAAKAIFDAWLEPLRDLGATRNVIAGIGSTDHVPFDDLGIPAFTIIKDFDAYDARTRHTNADFIDRMTEDELKQSAVFMAHFAWQAAQRDERIPRVAP